MQLGGSTLAVLGEVRTTLLPESAALSRDSAAELVAVAHGVPVRSRDRPVSWAQSPVVAEGVDCRLTVPSSRRVRAVGAVAVQATVTGGRIVQTAACCALVGAQSGRRQPWVHYMGQVGVLDVLTPITPGIDREIAQGFVAMTEPANASFDPGAIAARMATRLRRSPLLNQRPPMYSDSTRLRWSARAVPGIEPSLTVTMHDRELRTVEIVVGDVEQLADVQAFCHDLAMHDWLLTALIEAADEAAEPFEPSDLSVERALSPMLEHLVHLWMPGAATPLSMRGMWTRLETDPGFSRQWHARVGQMRDGLAVATLTALNRARSDW
ncbi:SCO2521 family protein [Nocardia sp. NPDC058666]|uniref:SCO2521 family protein n=1 Tax=unclassified Nocardia TaxID=2637762 RepID=UPI00366A2626